MVIDLLKRLGVPRSSFSEGEHAVFTRTECSRIARVKSLVKAEAATRIGELPLAQGVVFT